MPRVYNLTTIAILQFLSQGGQSFLDAKQSCAPKLSAKDFANYIFRLTKQGLIEKRGQNLKLTTDGEQLRRRLVPQTDGVWKIVVFDIPEKNKYVRTVLRAKLKQLHFKKWQNSIWVSPFQLDGEIEHELLELGKKFFVRLIKTTQINREDDLKKMFNLS